MLYWPKTFINVCNLHNSAEVMVPLPAHLTAEERRAASARNCGCLSCLCCTSWNKQCFPVCVFAHRMDSLKFCTCFGVQLPRHLLLTSMQQQTVSLPSLWVHFKCSVALKFDVKLLLYCFIKQFFIILPLLTEWRWYMPLMPALERQRQLDLCGLKASSI